LQAAFVTARNDAHFTSLQTKSITFDAVHAFMRTQCEHLYSNGKVIIKRTAHQRWFYFVNSLTVFVPFQRKWRRARATIFIFNDLLKPHVKMGNYIFKFDSVHLIW